jgi:uncharacterized protein YbjT (DUF2867 family)
MRVLVIASTGKVGSRLIPLLVEKGVEVNAATRHPESYSGEGKVVAFDFADHSTFAPALEGVDRVFFVAPDIAPPDVQAFVDAAAHVQHIVMLSANGVQYAPDSPLGQAEQSIKNSGIAYTILRPGWFMQNFSEGNFSHGIKQAGGIHLPAGDAKVAFIDARDIAATAAAALTEDGHANKEYTLTGREAISHDEVARIISEVSGRSVQYHAIEDQDFIRGMVQAGMPEDYAGMLVGLFQAMRQGMSAQVSPDVKQATGREPYTFQQFATDHADHWA